MRFERLTRFLLEPDAERDEAFREKVRELSRNGLRVIGIVSVLLTVFMMVAIRLVTGTRTPPSALIPVAGILVCGGVCYLLSRTRFGAEHGRGIGCTTGLIVGAQLMWISLIKATVTPQAEAYIAGQSSIVMMIALVTLPLRPIQAFLLALGLGVVYAASVPFAGVLLGVDATASASTILVFLLMMMLLGTWLASVIYRRTWETHKAGEDQLAASKELFRAQLKTFVSESAATTGKLAAAVSHELNTPVGTLKSSIETLDALAVRRKTAPENQVQRIETLERELRLTAMKAAVRLQEMVGRMQRITNLDRAEYIDTDLNGLVRDVIYLLDSQARLKQVTVDLALCQDLPQVRCSPQQIGAVISTLLETTVNASGHEGGVRVESRRVDSRVEVAFQTSGPELSMASTQVLFAPAFQEEQGRMGTANWGLFTARQILRQNGGDMRIETGRGNRPALVLALPA